MLSHLTILGLAATLAAASASPSLDTASPTPASADIQHPDGVAVSESVITQAPFTPEIEERGYIQPNIVGYRSYDGYYWSAIPCYDGYDWASYSGYGACCPAGATVCSSYATSCAGNTPVFWGGRTGKDCSPSFCDTLTVMSNLDGTSAATAKVTDVLCFANILNEVDPRTAYKQTWNLRPTSTSTSTHTSQTATSTRKPNAGMTLQRPSPLTLFGAVLVLVLLL